MRAAWGRQLCLSKCLLLTKNTSQTLMSLNTMSRLQRMANNVDPSKFQVLIRKNPPIYLNILSERDQTVWLLWEPRTLSEDGLSGSFMFSGHWPLSGLGRLGQRWIMEISGDKLRPAWVGWGPGDQRWSGGMNGQTIHWNTDDVSDGWWLAKNQAERETQEFFLIYRENWKL